MRANQTCSAVAAIVCAMALGVSAAAQIIPCVGVGVVGLGSTLGILGRTPNKVPFSGVVKTTFDQKLGDGNIIHRVTRGRLARDSAGRIMTETFEGCVPGPGGELLDVHGVNVRDPLAGTIMSWLVGTDDRPKVVQVSHELPPRPQTAQPPAARREPTPEELAQRQKRIQAALGGPSKQQQETRVEDLGIKDFNGISTQGTRVTRAIPAGEEGNERPLVVINETWTSKELGLIFMTIRDDPRTGRTVTEYEEFTRGEPNPDLFTPPPGYTVQDHPHVGVMGGMVQSGALP